MDARKLGRTDVEVSPIGLGCWQFSQGKGATGRMWSVLDQGTMDGVVGAAILVFFALLALAPQLFVGALQTVTTATGGPLGYAGNRSWISIWVPSSLRTMRRAGRMPSGRPESKPEASWVGETSLSVWRVSIARMTSYGCDVRRTTNSAIRAGLSATLRSLARSSRGQRSIARSR